jgi:hypothetical protein
MELLVLLMIISLKILWSNLDYKQKEFSIGRYRELSEGEEAIRIEFEDEG